MAIFILHFRKKKRKNTHVLFKKVVYLHNGTKKLVKNRQINACFISIQKINMKQSKAAENTIEIQKQILVFFMERPELKMNALEKSASMAKSAIGRALKKMRDAGSFEKMIDMPFSPQTMCKALKLCLKFGMRLTKGEHTIWWFNSDGENIYYLEGNANVLLTWAAFLEKYKEWQLEPKPIEENEQVE